MMNLTADTIIDTEESGEAEKPKKLYCIAYNLANFVFSIILQSPSMADNLLTEQRSEFMVSPTSSHEHFKTSHFLTPSVTSINSPVTAPSFNSSTSSKIKCKELPFKLNFRGWRYPQENWKKWAHKMRTLHHSTWKRAEIHDAIMNTTFTVHRHDDLVFGFVEKWCPSTNSFVFPWGEATVTLEDIIMLGGYSVLGDSVLSPPGNGEMEETVKKLFTARSAISSSKSRKPSQGMWMNKFMNSGSEIEHEAFLAYWLSRFVFPFWRDVIGRNVVSIAVHLARGTKIALAPAVLANIYQSLTLLKTRVVSARKSGGKKRQEGEITVSAPLALFQIWVWERFPSLRPPNHNPVGKSEPRFARWHNLKKLEIKDLSLEIDSADENFQWRPYSAVLSEIYKDTGYWALIESDLSEDLEGAVRCLRTSELVGLEKNCIEQYLPHRVSMQFGMDQDLPGHEKRVNANPENAWRNYSRPIRDVKIYVPGRLYEPGVTTRYFKWWKELSEHDFVPPPPGFSPKWKRDQTNSNFTPREIAKGQSTSISSAEKDVNAGSCEKGSFKSLKRKFAVSSSSDDSAPVCTPTGFAPKGRKVEVSDSGILGSDKVVVELSDSGSNGNSQSRDEARDEGPNRLSSTKDNGDVEETTLSADNCPVSTPTGFAPKGRKAEAWGSGILESEKVVLELSSSGSNWNSRSRDEARVEGRTRLSSTKDNGNVMETTLSVEAAERDVRYGMQKEVSEGWVDGLESRSGDMMSGIKSSKSEGAGLGLEERIRNIEKLCDWLKSGKLKISCKRK
ncbi:hypothetical protein BUALT_Bualt03G0120200 [Buddleja alternifolia]|uniref:Aminotransferase-like plant mobile domain-containing protein n=1 Tax=Buddleja alternifolia TaxID=168488 RepID=A0AAV6Y4B1_9LAMI|nr:hypothetical protein BUALT_Bualt03G0120200 [Buddleja alternifolia]